MVSVADTPAPPGIGSSPLGVYYANQNMVLSYFKQPWRTPQQRVQMRVNLANISVAAGDGWWVESGTGTHLDPGANGLWLGAWDTPWFDVPQDGLVHVRWQSDATQELDYSSGIGVTVGGYEYRRYEAGASPWWPKLRFPGQYADDETGWFENWNRFYDPVSGRYTAPDPLLKAPISARNDAINFFLVRPYGYAALNPLAFSDPAGLTSIILVGGPITDDKGRDVKLDTEEKRAAFEKLLKEKYLLETGEKSTEQMPVNCCSTIVRFAQS